MPQNLVNALVWLIWIAGVVLILFIFWLYYCECRRWVAAAGLPHIAAIYSPFCPAGDGSALAQLRMHPDRLG